MLLCCYRIEETLFADWIMQLGPQNFGPDELYAYSLVSNPTRTFNYVLARDVDDFNEVTTQSLLRALV